MTYDEILAYINQMQASPVDVRAAMTSNPNDPNPGPGSGGLGQNIAWGNVPGLEQFYSYDAQNNAENFDIQSALPEMERLGYTVMQGSDPGSQAMGGWIVGPDGKPIAQSARLTGTNDDRFKLAALAAMGITGANVLGAGFGAGGAAAQTTAPAATASGQPLNMAMIESGLGTPGYGYNAGAAASGLFDPAVIGSGAGSMFGPGGSVVANPSYGGLSGVDAAMSDLATSAPITPGASVPSGGLLGGIGDAATKVGGFIADNPKLVGAIGGALLPLVDNEDTTPEAYTGPMPTITRGDWKPRQQANYMQIPQFGSGFMTNQQPANNSGLLRYTQGRNGLLGG